MQGRAGNAMGAQGAGMYPWLGAGTGAAMLGQGLAGLFGDNKGPFEAGSPYYERIMRELPNYFQPWMGAGQQALPQLQQQYGQLLSGAGGMYNQFASGYQQSPGYQWRQNQGQQAAMNAAAAGGMSGSPQHQQFAAQTSEDIANQDFMNYLQSIMGLYGQGLSGLGGLSHQGLLASMGLGEDISSVLARQAEAAMRGEQYQQQQESGNWGNILGGIGTLAGSLFGGPVGGMAGGGIGSALGGLFGR